MASAGPSQISSFAQRYRMVMLRESLVGLSVSTDDRQGVYAVRSNDTGQSWTNPERILDLSPEAGRWSGVQPIVDDRGHLHLILVNDRGTGVFARRDDRPRRVLPMDERRIDVWHARAAELSGPWTGPKRIWQGYTGSINCAIQTSSGRIVVPFAAHRGRTWTDRLGGADEFWYTGTSAVTVMCSDDRGDTWMEAPRELTVQTPSLSTYGAIEPVVLELEDGTLWMLIRTQLGRFYESRSSDGLSWSKPVPTSFVSSDSPGGLVRTADGRIVLFRNACQRFPYAYGGRHVLHASVSDDDGATWRGEREVFRDPLRHLPPPPGGDFGTAYPFPIALPDGSVAFTSGQGEGRIAMMRFDPEWLVADRQVDDFSDDSVRDGWMTFGCAGVGFEGNTLIVSKPESGWPVGIVRNFPAMSAGTANVSVTVVQPADCVRLMLTDHFSVPFDPEDARHAVFVVELPGVVQSGTSVWELSWDCRSGSCRLAVDGVVRATVNALRSAPSVNYLRLRPILDSDDGRLEIHGARFVSTERSS